LAKKKIPILLVTHDRPYLLDKVLRRLIQFTDWSLFELWICDNSSTKANNKIIEAYTHRYKEIKVFHQDINQISLIQNNLIAQLKADVYIKLDDDIFVGENWYKGFLGVFERHTKDISIGSVIIPINGFGWVPFLDIMNLKEIFFEKFPQYELFQGCMEPAVWYDKEVNKFIWEQCLDIDQTNQNFVSNQSNFQDYIVPHRYSIGAIIFSHKFWEKMGGWKINHSFYRNYRLYKFLTTLNNKLAKIRNRQEQRRIEQIIKIATSMSISELGTEEEYLYNFSNQNGLKQYITSESIVFHFAFGPTESYLMKKIFLKIKF